MPNVDENENGRRGNNNGKGTPQIGTANRGQQRAYRQWRLLFPLPPLRRSTHTSREKLQWGPTAKSMDMFRPKKVSTKMKIRNMPL